MHYRNALRKGAVCFLSCFIAAMPLQASASIIKFPPKETKTETGYKDLICTEQDKANIYEIITTMAENSKLSLLLKQSHMKQIGAQINHVHPLKFLAAIFSNPRLKMCMIDIFNDYFKRTGLMDGLGPSLQKEAERGKLIGLLPEFAAEVNVPAENLRPYFEAMDWENMVRFLIQS